MLWPSDILQIFLALTQTTLMIFKCYSHRQPSSTLICTARSVTVAVTHWFQTPWFKDTGDCNQALGDDGETTVLRHVVPLTQEELHSVSSVWWAEPLTLKQQLLRWVGEVDIPSLEIMLCSSSAAYLDQLFWAGSSCTVNTPTHCVNRKYIGMKRGNEFKCFWKCCRSTRQFCNCWN